jgi:hypothetical protein
MRAVIIIIIAAIFLIRCIVYALLCKKVTRTDILIGIIGLAFVVYAYILILKPGLF